MVTKFLSLPEDLTARQEVLEKALTETREAILAQQVAYQVNKVLRGCLTSVFSSEEVAEDSKENQHTGVAIVRMREVPTKRGRRPRLTEEERCKIVELLQYGAIPQKKIAEMFNVDASVVSKLKNGQY